MESQNVVKRYAGKWRNIGTNATETRRPMNERRRMVFVDTLMHHGFKVRGKPVKSCHLFADKELELHRFVELIGLRRSWYHGPPRGRWPHYDIVSRFRALAIELGAVPLDRYQAVNFFDAKGWGSRRKV